jgi:hypothetical protein
MMSEIGNAVQGLQLHRRAPIGDALAERDERRQELVSGFAGGLQMRQHGSDKRLDQCVEQLAQATLLEMKIESWSTDGPVLDATNRGCFAEDRPRASPCFHEEI